MDQPAPPAPRLPSPPSPPDRGSDGSTGGVNDGLRWLAGLAWANGRARVVAVVALSVAAGLAEGAGLMAIVPLLALLDSAPPAGETPALGPVLGLYLAVVAAAGTVVAARALVAHRQRADVIDRLRLTLHRAVLDMEWAAVRHLRPGAVAHVLNTEVARAGTAFDRLQAAIAAALTLPVVAAVGFALSPRLTLGGLAVALLAAIAGRGLTRQAARLGRTMGAARQAFTAGLVEDLGGLRLIRALAVEDRRHARAAAGLDDLRRQERAHVRLTVASGTVVRVGGAVAAAGGLVVAVHGLGLAVAEALVLVLAFARLVSHGLRLQDSWRQVVHHLPGAVAVRDLLTACASAREAGEAGTAEPRLLPPEAPPPAITLEAVTLRHQADAPPALDRVSAVLPAGQVTAVVGASGAGKSTLADVLLGLLAPQDGMVCIDARPLDGTTRRAWRRAVGYVPQEAFLFHDTIRANLTLAAPEADEAALWAALAMAAADDLVRSLPHGLDTVVGDRGASLSGGERQRLTIARALVRQPALLILDEATGALDAARERAIHQALERLHGKASVVVIAHRASVTALADQVLVLDRGRLVAAGPWETVRHTPAVAGLLA